MNFVAGLFGAVVGVVVLVLVIWALNYYGPGGDGAGNAWK